MVTKDQKFINGMYLSKSIVIIILVFFFATLLTMGLLIGLLGRRTNTEKVIYMCPDETKPPITESESSSGATTNAIGTTKDPYGDGPWTLDRLPDGIEPENYHIFIYNIDLAAGIYKGTTDMYFKLNRDDLRYLLFHIKNINVSSVELYHEGTTKIDIKDQFSYVRKQYYVLDTKSTLSSGKYHLIVNYSGSSKTGIVGMYQSNYIENGVVKTMIATKFEPTDARKAFPCFDEPALKATYDVTLQYPIGYYALSNFETISNITTATYIETKFNTTFKMSTYLISWAIVPSDFGYKQAMSKQGKPVRVYARRLAVDSGLIDYALQVAKDSLDYFENEYFKISLAVPPKIDLIAIPEFPSGAMEHWGLIGFRETRLLFDETKNSVSQKQSVASTIAHELAHFWFGNLVTCKWWNDLWLNEAMATFLKNKAIEALYGDWDIDQQTLIEDTVPVMWDDGFPRSHPVEADVTTPDQINNVFDSITYSKGGSILRMLEAVVGKANFQKGLQDYLIQNQYSSGVAADFYNTLEFPADMKPYTSGEQFMNTWLKQMNYPVVDIQLKYNNGKTVVSFEQDRFLLTEEDLTTTPIYVSPYNYVWEIYLQCYAGGLRADDDPLSGGMDNFTYFLNKKQGEKELNKEYKWVKCNQDFRGFYLTDYSTNSYSLFAKVLIDSPDKFTVGDRADFLQSSYMLAYLGTKSYSVPAEFSAYLHVSESSYIPWRVFIYHINRLSLLLEHRPSFSDLSAYSKAVVSAFVKKLNIWENSGEHLEKLLKSSMVEFVCRMRNEDCLVNATRQFEQIDGNYFTTPNSVSNSVSPNIRSSVYKYHLQNTYKDNDWFKLLKVYQDSLDPQEQAIVLNAMSYTKTSWILNYYLTEILKAKSEIRIQDFFTVVNAISRNPSGRSLAWYFLREFWSDIVNKFGIQDRTFGRSVKTVCETFQSKYLYDEMIAFFQKEPNAGAGESPRLQAIDIVTSNILWINDREKDAVDNLFKFKLN